MRGHREIADDLRQRIRTGYYSSTKRLPKLEDLADEYDVNRQTIRAAIDVLASEGLIIKGRGRQGGAALRDLPVVRIALERYAGVLRPGGLRGPWETACAEQGYDGRMVVVEFEPHVTSVDAARALGLADDAPLAYRRRHALIGEQLHHIQQVWYPADLVAGTALAEGSKVVGGAFGLLAALGYPPEDLTEEVTARMPTKLEEVELGAGARVPMLNVQRITRDGDGRALELLTLAGPADRIVLVYDKNLSELRNRGETA